MVTLFECDVFGKELNLYLYYFLIKCVPFHWLLSRILSWPGDKLKLLTFLLSGPSLFLILLLSLVISCSSLSDSSSSYIESILLDYPSPLNPNKDTFLNYDWILPFFFLVKLEPLTDLLALAVSKTFFE